MHFNIYLDDHTGQVLTNLAKKKGETRNALVREAIADWIKRSKHEKWPQLILDHQGFKDFSAFELHRNELISPSNDPLS